MSHFTQPVSMPTPNPSVWVQRHEGFRGVTTIRDLLGEFTMYSVVLENIGDFISDSRPEAFNMAYEAILCHHKI